jgi:hypothetical protein
VGRALGALPYGLMSLSEMINCHVSSLCALCAQLMLEEVARSDDVTASNGIDDAIADSCKERIRGWLKIATLAANDFEWQAVHDRVARIKRKLEKPMSHRDLGTEMRILRETIDSGFKWQLIYRYPQEKNALLSNWMKDWAEVLDKFPSSKSDVFAGVDLWALGHSTASVFHFMRVLEHGLRALAKDVGKSFEIQNWQNIIDQIESEIRTLGKALPAGTAKSDRLKFLSEAAKEFVYFKDGWRNYVSHNRATYDEHLARSAMEHVRSFMTGLSSRLNE